MLRVGCSCNYYELLQFVHDHRHCMDWKSIGALPAGDPLCPYCISSVKCRFDLLPLAQSSVICFLQHFVKIPHAAKPCTMAVDVCEPQDIA